MTVRHLFVVAACSLALLSCKTDGTSASAETGPTPTATLSPTQTPSPTPSPTLAPSPTPTPTATQTPAPPAVVGVLEDGVTVVVAEGDSITSPNTVKYYAGAFRDKHPGVTFHNAAVGGSTLKQLIARRDADMALRPDILTVFVGANGFGPTGAAYAAEVLAYVAPFRAMGTKVYVATVLPRVVEGDNFDPAVRNAERIRYAEIMTAAVGTQIDGVIDFGRAPIIGDNGAPLNKQLYGDGLHPTPRDANGGIGGHDYLFDLYEAAISRAIRALTN